MILSPVHHISNIGLCLLPSPKEMMEMDSLCFNSHWNEQDYLEVQYQPSFHNWLLVIPDVCPVGMLAFQAIPPELEILRMAIHPEWRKRGLAELMLEQLEILTKSDKIESHWLEVHVANKSATSLYRKLGYKEIGSRRNYFRNPLGDALLYKKIVKENAS